MEHNSCLKIYRGMNILYLHPEQSILIKKLLATLKAAVLS